MKKTKLYNKLSEMVEAVESIDGVEVDNAEVSESESKNVFSDIFNTQDQSDEEYKMVIVARLEEEGPKQEKPNSGPEDNVSISFSSGDNMKVSEDE